jgi:hypothetical protein
VFLDQGTGGNSLRNGESLNVRSLKTLASSWRGMISLTPRRMLKNKCSGLQMNAMLVSMLVEVSVSLVYCLFVLV